MTEQDFAHEDDNDASDKWGAIFLGMAGVITYMVLGAVFGP